MFFLSIRIFKNNLDKYELKWHYDDRDRIIIPLWNRGWFFQYDNQLPFILNRPLFIKSKRYHRIIKGKSNLIILLVKL